MSDLPFSWLLLIPAVLLFGCPGTRPANLGVTEGKLAPCPSTPNCVSSQASDEPHRVAPFPFAGPPDEAMRKMNDIVRSLPRTVVVTFTGTYLHAECTSLVFRFVDDVEFLVDGAAKVIHVRSASRIGRSDLGVNRTRIEQIRVRWDPGSGP